MRRAALRAAAWGVVAAGVAAPLVRKRVRVPPTVVQAVAFAAPVGLCVAVRRSRARDLAACGLQMWAYVAAYKFPHDDPVAQERRVHVRYPIVIDRVLGWGELPSLRRRVSARGSRATLARKSKLMNLIKSPYSIPFSTRGVWCSWW